MNKILKKDFPTLFVDILELAIDKSYNEHRRNSNFYTKSIIQLSEEDKEYFPTIENFEQFYGTWETNQYISDTEYGTDMDEIIELNRVELVEETVTVKTWKLIK